MITQVTGDFVRAAIDRGCAGIFFATQDATHQAFDETSYRRIAEPGDRRVLLAARDAGGWFNVMHMHGDDVLFDVLKHYPVDALNWHIGETPPAIGDYRASGGTLPIVGSLMVAMDKPMDPDTAWPAKTMAAVASCMIMARAKPINN